MPITADDQPISITDLALRPSSNTLYGTSLNEGDFTNSIYTINPATGVATLIGNAGVIGATLAFGPDGTLYQTSAVFDEVGFVAGYLNTLDPDTGAVLRGQPAVAGIAESIISQYILAGKELTEVDRQFIGSVVRYRMETNGYRKAEKTGSIPYRPFTQGQLYQQILN